MQKTSKRFKRKAAGMMAAVMMMSALPVNMVGFADTSVNSRDSYDTNDRTATEMVVIPSCFATSVRITSPCPSFAFE